MSNFDESKHPRDGEGKFTNKDGSTEYRQNTSYGEILGKKPKKKNDNRKKFYGKKETKINKDNYSEHAPDKGYVYKKGYIAGAKKGNKMSFEQADNGACNPYYDKVEGYGDNCQACVAVYIARRLGYNVRVLPYLYSGAYTNDEMRHLANNPYRAYKDAQNEQPQAIEFFGDDKQGFLNKTIQNGEIYSVVHYWENDAGHITIAEKDSDGNLFLYDPQSNKKRTGKEIKNYFNGTKSNIMCANLTNVTMNEIVCDKIMKKVN